MTQKNVYRKKVNRNTVILVVIGLVLFGIGSLRLISAHGAESIGANCYKLQDEEIEGWSVSQCSHHWGAYESEQRDSANSDALFCYTIFVLLLAGCFIYRSHALITKE